MGRMLCAAGVWPANILLAWCLLDAVFMLLEVLPLFSNLGSYTLSSDILCLLQALMY